MADLKATEELREAAIMPEVQGMAASRKGVVLTSKHTLANVLRTQFGYENGQRVATPTPVASRPATEQTPVATYETVLASAQAESQRQTAPTEIDVDTARASVSAARDTLSPEDQAVADIIAATAREDARQVHVVADSSQASMNTSYPQWEASAPNQTQDNFMSGV